MSDWNFSLQRIAPIAKEYAPPPVSVETGERFEMVYDLISLTIRPKSVGKLRMTIIPEGQGKKRIRTRVERIGSGDQWFHLGLDYLCHDNAYATPLTWSAEGYFAERDGSAVVDLSRFTASGRLKKGVALVTQSGNETRTTVGEFFAAKYPLIEGIRAYGAKAPAVESEFTCLDEYHISKPKHRLQSPVGFDVVLDNRRMRPFLHLGEAQIPRMLWLDESGWVNFYTSGTEAAVLESVNEVSADYELTKFQIKAL